MHHQLMDDKSPCIGGIIGGIDPGLGVIGCAVCKSTNCPVLGPASTRPDFGPCNTGPAVVPFTATFGSPLAPLGCMIVNPLGILKGFADGLLMVAEIVLL